MPQATRPTPHRSVSIVDDSAVSRAQIGCVLRSLRYDIAFEGEEVRSIADGFSGIVIIDGRLPFALTAIATLRERSPDAAVFVLAALDEIAFVRAAVATGATGAIRRPPLASHVRAAFAALG